MKSILLIHVFQLGSLLLGRSNFYSQNHHQHKDNKEAHKPFLSLPSHAGHYL